MISSPYLKTGLVCALFATVIGLALYSPMLTEPAKPSPNNGLVRCVLQAPPPPPPPVELVEEAEVYRVVEKMPRFPGCEHISDSRERQLCADQKLVKYVVNNLKYPQEAKEKGLEGVAVISFMVNKTGEVYGEQLLRDPGHGMGAEALRVMKTMSTDNIRWTPGINKGKPVTVSFNLPVKFKLE